MKQLETAYILTQLSKTNELDKKFKQCSTKINCKTINLKIPQNRISKNYIPLVKLDVRELKLSDPMLKLRSD